MTDDRAKVDFQLTRFILRKWDRTEDKEAGLPPDEVVVVDGDSRAIYHPRLGDAVPDEADTYRGEP